MHFQQTKSCYVNSSEMLFLMSKPQKKINILSIPIEMIKMFIKFIRDTMASSACPAKRLTDKVHGLKLGTNFSHSSSN